MDDQQRGLLLEAMMHLETATEGPMIDPARREEAYTRMVAAHYLIQAAVQGHKPSNYDEFLSRARAYDDVRDVMERLRPGE